MISLPYVYQEALPNLNMALDIASFFAELATCLSRERLQRREQHDGYDLIGPLR